MLVLLGTLVTAVASFYFGAKTASSAQAAAADLLTAKSKLVITSISPLTWSAAQGALQHFVVAGSGLDSVKDLKLSLAGEQDVIGERVLPGKNAISCVLPIGATTKPGKWDVVLTEHDNYATRSAGAFTLTA